MDLTVDLRFERRTDFDDDRKLSFRAYLEYDQTMSLRRERPSARRFSQRLARPLTFPHCRRSPLRCRRLLAAGGNLSRSTFAREALSARQDYTAWNPTRKTEPMPLKACPPSPNLWLRRSAAPRYSWW